MQLLFEEFFSKIFNVVDSLGFPLKNILKLFIYLFLLFLILLGIFYVYKGKYILVAIVSGIIILAEIAHFIRKNMESEVSEVSQDVKENKTKKQKIRRKIKNIKKSKTLGKEEMPKNKDLLDLNKSKNNKSLFNSGTKKK